MDGATNFRDLGGHRTTDGRRVRRGRIFRSNSLDGLTPSGREAFRRLGVGVVVDLRAVSEREANPAPNFEGVRYVASDKLSPSDVAESILGLNDAPEETWRAGWQEFYHSLPIAFAPEYRELFRVLLDTEDSVVVNCSAGKDRTGVVSALLLASLGVPRQAIVSDYVISDRGLGTDRAVVRMLSDDMSDRFGELPDYARALMLGADPFFLEAVLDRIEKDYGSVDGYLETHLGISAAELENLRKVMLEP